jgi:NAD(P)H-hydrate repair Nnr-like enzyme with NAD(P)H-hydrate dehydratase domain
VRRSATAIRADTTVTFGHLKVGLLTPDGARLAGRGPRGRPRRRRRASILEQVGHTAQVLHPLALLRSYFVPREANVAQARRGQRARGRGLARQARRRQARPRGPRCGPGAGLVTTCAPGPRLARSIEPQLRRGDDSRASICERSGRAIDAALEGRHVVAIGPGFGLDEAARLATEHVVLGWDGVKVVDADAISLFVGRAKDLLERQVDSLVLTPHPGELGRLLGRSGSRDIEQDRLGAVREAVRRTGAGRAEGRAHHDRRCPTVRCTSLCIAGNPALATAGSGDVLTGIIAALGCSMRPDRATCAGVLVHALAADQWSASTGSDRGPARGGDRRDGARRHRGPDEAGGGERAVASPLPGPAGVQFRSAPIGAILAGEVGMRSSSLLGCLVVGALFAGVACESRDEPEPSPSDRPPSSNTTTGSGKGNGAPPISGGTLLITRDLARAVVADPDRDRVVVVNLESNRVLGELALDAGSEPGRAVEDADGRVHVVLRRGDAVLTLSRDGSRLGERSVCEGPRGIGYDEENDQLLVACVGGELERYAATTGGARVSRANLGPDLRDVVVSAGRTFVSRFSLRRDPPARRR